MAGCYCLAVAIGLLAVTQKTLSLSHYQHCHGSQVDVSYCVNGFRVDSCHNRAPFVLAVVLHFSWYRFLFTYFKSFQTFVVRCGLGLLTPTKRSLAYCTLVMN